MKLIPINLTREVAERLIIMDITEGNINYKDSETGLLYLRDNLGVWSQYTNVEPQLVDCIQFDTGEG